MMELKEIKRGDIFYINIPKDENDKHKQIGYRPCIIISNDMNNKHCSRVQYIPLTSKLNKTKLPTHVHLVETKMEKESIALCECIDAIDRSFIKEKVGVVSLSDMRRIELGVAIQLYQGTSIQFLINNQKKVMA